MQVKYKVIKWFNAYPRNRTYQLDMAGFAINIKLIINRSDNLFNKNLKPGMQEEYIISKIINDISELECKADNCMKVIDFAREAYIIAMSA